MIGNPWPGKKSLSVKSDHILADQTEMDELDNGLGAEVSSGSARYRIANALPTTH